MNIADGAIGRLSPEIFDQWLNYEVFETDLVRACATMSARAGLSHSVDVAQLRIAHGNWVIECNSWRATSKMPAGTVHLSHFKTLAILLRHLSDKAFVFFTKSALPDPWLEVYGKLSELPERATKKFVDGQHHYVAWLLILNVLVWFERDRDDKKTPCVVRVTDDFENDMISLLLSGLHSSDSLYLILEAIFLRD